MQHRLTLLFILGALIALYSGRAAAEVRRCVTPAGQEVFTDRKCDEVGATERVPREQAQASGGRTRGGGCARNLQDLVFELTTAIDAHDTNRIAGVYHWTGMSSDAGYQTWTRLDAIANRPLVDIVPVMPASSPSSMAADDNNEGGTSNDAGKTASASQPTHNETSDADLYPQTTLHRTPVALRVEQTLANSATPSRTVFGLTRNFGCWWLRF
ncbi:MAG TPA: hypothetical protein VGQ93_10680 [Lysobacter sp.]|jgi:hypothetical protein|nr:hypothetical protein [Lysobacter sp.]